jgi:hypothetical protein
MMIEREASWSLLQYLICVLALNAGNVIVVKRAHWFTLERDGILDLFAVLPFLPIIICYLHVLLYPIYLDTFFVRHSSSKISKIPMHHDDTSAGRGYFPSQQNLGQVGINGL